MEIILKTENITKQFSGSNVAANNKISVSFEKGEIHAIVGENGSGKSTLMHIVSGLIKPDSGTIIYSGKPVIFRSPYDALMHGIGMVHQSPGIVPGFTVLENIIIGTDKKLFSKINKTVIIKKLEEIKTEYKIKIDLNSIPDSMEARQITLLLSLIYKNAEVIIFDEPVDSFAESSGTSFYSILGKLHKKGKTIIIITHNIPLAVSRAEKITVLSKGNYKGTFITKEIDINFIADIITGEDKKLTSFNLRKNRKAPGSKVIYEAKDIVFPAPNQESKTAVINFSVREGEIFSFTGIRDRNIYMLENLLSNFLVPKQGKFYFKGKDITGSSIRSMRRSGINYIPSDRFERGTSLSTSVEENLTFTHIRDFTDRGFLKRKSIRDFFNIGTKTFDIKAKFGQPLWQLSGGNIQKVILFREMYKNAKLLLFCEPSANLDIQSRDMVYKALFKLKNSGTSIIIISTDMEEVIYLSDRVAVMNQGKIEDILESENINSHNIGRLALGIKIDEKNIN